MKKRCLLFLCFIASSVLYSDVIPDHSHSVDKCVKIINAADFPDISIVALIKHPAADKAYAEIIDPKSCLSKDYKFNTFQLIAVRKDYLAHKNLDSIEWIKGQNCLFSNIDIEPYGGYEDNANPLCDVEEYYKIESITDSAFILYKCKEITKFNNGRPASVKTYSYKSGHSILEKSYDADTFHTLSQNTASVNVIIDFLKALFFTILIETLVLFFFFKILFKKQAITDKSLLVTGILASTVTLPYLWFILPVFIQSFFWYVLAGELSVVLLESLIIAYILKPGYRRALIISACCNLCSFLAGLLLQYKN